MRRILYFLLTAGLASAQIIKPQAASTTYVDGQIATRQPLDATLTALAAQNWAANAMLLGTGSDAVSQLALAANTFPARSSTGNVSAKVLTDSAIAAMAIEVGTAGGIVTNGGAGGTPLSITLTNGTGLPISTGISGLGTGVATALAVNTGSAGAFTTFNGAGGTPSSIVLTNATGLPLTTGVTGTLGVTNGGNGLATATLGDVRYGSGTNTIAALAGNTSATMAVLTQTGNGSVSAPPVWTTTSGTGGFPRLDIPTFTTRIQSPIYRGTGTDVVIQDGSGNQAFRSINATTWTDSAAGQYFQIGGSSVNVVFTAGSASNVNRMGHFAEYFQISSGSRASCPIPVDKFEVVNSSNVKVFGVNGTGTATAVGDLTCSAAGKGLRLKSGTDARAGNATLVAGTVTVSNTTVTANTLVHLTRKTSGGTLGTAITYTLSAGASFTITSDSALDTSTFTYLLTELD